MKIRLMLGIPDSYRVCVPNPPRPRKRSVQDFSWAEARVQELARAGIPARVIRRRGESPCVVYNLRGVGSR